MTIHLQPGLFARLGAQKIVPAQPSGYWDITFEFC